VVIAAARQDRTFLPPADQCPLDPSGPGRPTEIPADNYDVVVFENRFPSLAEPLGRCEVVCFTPDHDASFAALSPRRVRTVLEAWVDRTQALGALPETRQVYCFENRGEEIGVTLHHPHGQIYAFPFVAPKLAQMVTQAREYAAGQRRREPVRRHGRGRGGGRDARRDQERALGGVRARGGALAVRGADIPARSGA
jgi:UDPglucose--hexose-1-phosphate uridylyltransferase